MVDCNTQKAPAVPIVLDYRSFLKEGKKYTIIFTPAIHHMFYVYSGTTGPPKILIRPRLGKNGKYLITAH